MPGSSTRLTPLARSFLRSGLTSRPVVETVPVVKLLADDEKPSRDVVAAILKRAGATVACAESVAEAFTAMGEQRPDVVICDIAMPGEDGYDFLRQFRASDDPIPVIALTAFGRPEDRENALARGFTAFLKKPVDPMLLAETVRDIAQVN